MILAVDAGNTRVKWGLWHDRGFVARGSVLTADAAALANALQGLARPRQTIGCNVAGTEVAARIEAALVPGELSVRWVQSERRQCGVTSGYAEPAQLGADRWCALIAARMRLTGPSLVVNAGTAVTIDALTGDGFFLGGLILPGMALMADALARATAGLPRQTGRLETFPTSTANAIHSGALQAVCGAVERMAQAMSAAGHPQPQLVLSGGAAETLAPLLARPAVVAPDLVLEGLVAIARA
jgi:type III pantothenate kinase